MRVEGFKPETVAAGRGSNRLEEDQQAQGCPFTFHSDQDLQQ